MTLQHYAVGLNAYLNKIIIYKSPIGTCKPNSYSFFSLKN